MEEINLYDLLRFYGRKWTVLVSSAIAGIIIGIIFTFYMQQPLYTSNATILLIGTNRTSANQESTVLNNYVSLFTSRRVLDPVIERQNYEDGFNTLSQNVEAQNVKNTDIIKVSVNTSSAKQSQSLLTDIIQEFNKQAKELYGSSSVKITVVDTASASNSASNIKPVRQIGLSAIGATVLAIIGLFFVYDYKNSQPTKKPAIKQAAVKSKPAQSTKPKTVAKKKKKNTSK